MKKDFSKLCFVIILIVAVIAMIATVAFALMYDTEAGLNAAVNSTANTIFDVAYWITAIFLFAVIVLALVFALYHLIVLFIDNPKKGLATIIPFGIAIVFYIVAYVISSPNDIPQEKLTSLGVSEGSSKAIGSGLIMTYVMLGLTVIAAVYAEVAKKFK